MLEFTYYNTEKINNLKDFFVLIGDIYNGTMPNYTKNTKMS